MAAKRKCVEVEALGVEAKAYPDALDDYDLLEAMADSANSGKLMVLVGRALFGIDGWKAVCDGLRGKDGKLPASRVGDFLDAVYGQIDELKN